MIYPIGITLLKHFKLLCGDDIIVYDTNVDIIYYDTSLNRINIVLVNIKRLLILQLDMATTPVQIIFYPRNYLQRLRKNKAKVADDGQILRDLLLVAIHDKSFESIRDNIIEKQNVPLMYSFATLEKSIFLFR